MQVGVNPCIGLYCGRIYFTETNNYSDCGVSHLEGHLNSQKLLHPKACPRGYRASNHECVECNKIPEFYDWLYITFMIFILIIIEWYLTEQCLKRRQLTIDVLALHIIVLVENVVSFILTLLIVDPIGSLQINTCSPQRLSDFYTLFYNPSPDYKNTIYCTHEAVYPLYSMIFIFYVISLSLVLFRVIYLRFLVFLTNLFVKSVFLNELITNANSTKTIYLTLYAIPALCFTHAIFSGLIYYSFPYIIIIGSIISVAIHMAFQLDQRPSQLLRSLGQKKNLAIILCHWLVHIYGIVSLTQVTNPSLHLPLLCLAPVPTLFYIITSKFTDPNKLDIE